jgi:hypothetical protein
MKKIVLAGISMLLVLTAGAAYALDIYYVQSKKAKIMLKPSFSGGTLGEVAKGTKLAAGGKKEGSWIKVLFNNKTGYVSSFVVAAHEPLDREGVIRADQEDIKQNVRRRASTYTSAAAARGLTSEDRKRLSMEEEVNYRALEKIEAFKVRDEEIAQFAEGR